MVKQQLVPRPRVPIVVQRASNELKPSAISNLPAEEIYKIIKQISRPRDEAAAGPIKLPHSFEPTYWVDVVLEMNKARERVGNDPLIFNTEEAGNRLPVFSTHPRYSAATSKGEGKRPRSDEPEHDSQAESDDSVVKVHKPPPRPRGRPRKKPKSQPMIESDEEDSHSKPKSISTDFLTKIPVLECLLVMQQVPFPCKACVATHEPCYVDLSKNPNCLKCRGQDKGCYFAPKGGNNKKRNSDPHKTHLAYLFHGHQIIRLATGQRLFEAAPDYDDV
ncbi:hypothetical protein K474DRAFT_1681030, partial [Panus rudis PR-1116 ss-1]